MTEVQILDQVVIRFRRLRRRHAAHWRQITSDSATVGNDFSTLPNSIRDPGPSRAIGGVSSFQLHFAARDIKTPGDRLDVLVAMNPRSAAREPRGPPPGRETDHRGRG